MVIIPITLTMAAVAALINFWLAIRIAQVRTKENIFVGDGGSELLIRRMRAQLNFAEYTPLVLFLILGIELSVGSAMLLWIVGAVYMLGRIAHGFGMDGAGLKQGRTIGATLTMIIIVGLAGYALYLVYSTFMGIADTPIMTV